MKRVLFEIGETYFFVGVMDCGLVASRSLLHVLIA